MGESVKLEIDGIEVAAGQGETIITAARKAGIYIPYLCAHPDLPSPTNVRSGEVIFRGSERFVGQDQQEYEGCQLCLVEIEGREDGVHRACITKVEDAMSVLTHTPRLEKLRRENLTRLLLNHPRTCTLCPQRGGCSLSSCSSGVPETERCCSKFQKCEIGKLVDYIGINENIPGYVHRGLPVVRDEPLFDRDTNLCVDCLRCVRVCQEAVGAGALGYTATDGGFIVGVNAPSLKKAKCRFCGACVDICPTGAMSDKPGKTPKRTHKLHLSPPIFPPEDWLRFEDQGIESVPEAEGVYRLLDEDKKTLYIAGNMNLHAALQEQLRSNTKARFFTFEVEPMYTSKESELLQQFLQVYGRLPEQNADLDDLF